MSAGGSSGVDDASRWRRVEELFHLCSEAPAGERDQVLREGAAGDAELEAEVRALLQSDSSIQQKLEEHRSTSGAGASSPQLERDGDAAEALVGTEIGRYRLDRVLGRGGMGVVYAAHAVAAPGLSVPGVPVAIKAVRRVLHSTPAVDQFLLERDALARLEHPHIARLLDGGITPDGLPYLVMEFIEGRRLDVVCDDPAVSAEAVVRLMLQLCEAVSHVHRNLILHRDLKPGNVMVTEEGVVKLLDFGTQKAMGPPVDSAMTQAGMRPVTMRYASPEHLRGEALSTASDVYSLGVLLYRLLSGKVPFAGENSSVAEFFERLRGGSISPPSAVAEGKARRAGRAMASDLDAIVLKAMRFEPGERYSTAEALAADLRRALEGQPVQARGGRLLYRAGKFYGRNRAVLWAGLAAVLVVGVGTGGMALQARRARLEQKRAEAGAERETALAHLLLFDYVKSLQQIPGSTDAQRRAVADALHFLDRLNRTDPSAAVELESVRAYTALGILLGSPYYQNLGDAPGGLEALSKALPVAERLVRGEPGNAAYLNALVGVQLSSGQVLMGMGKARQAREALEAASVGATRLAAEPGADRKTMLQAATVAGLLCDNYSNRGSGMLVDSDKATAAGEQMLRIARQTAARFPPCPPCQRSAVIALTKLGSVQESLDVEKAHADYAEALGVLEGLPAAEQSTVPVQRSYGIVRNRLIMLEIYAGHHPAELIAQEEAASLKAIAADPLDARARYDLAAMDSSMMDAYRSAGDHAKERQAATRFLESTTVLVKLQPKNPTYRFLYAAALLHHGRALQEAKQVDQGSREMDEGMALLMPLAEDPDAEPDTLGTASEFLVAMRRDPARDGPLAVKLMQRSIGDAGQPTSDQLLGLAEAEQFAGNAAGAREAASKALALLQEHPHGGLGQVGDVAQARKLMAYSPVRK